MRCSFCDKSVDDVAHLIDGPGVTICDGCIAVALEPTDDDHDQSCEFCRELSSRRVFARRGHAICDACIDMCCDILRDARRQPELPRAIARKAPRNEN